MKKSLIMAAVAAAVALTGCGGKETHGKTVPAAAADDPVASALDTAVPAPAPDTATTFTDTRDGQVYRIVRVGGQTWFAENLNYAAKGSKCYENSPDSCAKYGRLYDWTTAPKACPAEWHLPIDDEWKTLVDYAGGRETAGTKLKSSTGWEPSDSVPAGTDEYGFGALPGANHTKAGYRGVWWSATKDDTSSPGYMEMMFNREYVKKNHEYRYYNSSDYELMQLRRAYGNKVKEHLLAVRCVRNDSAYNAAAANLARKQARIQAASGTFTDPRDGKTYRTIKVGKQKWMAENLNYAAEGSKCYGEGDSVILGREREVRYTDRRSDIKEIKKMLSDAKVQAYCAKYGRLYDWETAKNACPAGWHLPSDDEWTALTDYAGGDSTAGTKLKSSTGWYRKNEYRFTPAGTDEYGFSALPGGYGGPRSKIRYFENADGDFGYWWSATEYDADRARLRYIFYDREDVNRGRGGYDKTDLLSVRCVADK